MLAPRRLVDGDPTLDTVLLRLMLAAILAGALLFVAVAVTRGDLAPPAPTAGKVVTEVIPDVDRERQVEPAIAGGQSRIPDGA